MVQINTIKKIVEYIFMINLFRDTHITYVFYKFS